MKKLLQLANKKHICLTYKIISAMISMYGLVVASGIHRGQFFPSMFFYYTNICNMLCFVWFTLSAVRLIRNRTSDSINRHKTYFVCFKGSLLVAVTILIITYWTMLFPNDEFSLFNLLLHLVIPLLLILDWLLIDKKEHFSKTYPLLWLIIPLAYYVYAMVIAQFNYTFYTGTRFVYFFLDYETLGVGIAMMCFIGIMVAALLIGYVYVFINNRMTLDKKE